MRRRLRASLAHLDRPQVSSAGRRAALAFAVFAALSVATLRAQDETARIPQLQPPPPLDPRFLQRFQGTVRTTIHDVSFRTSLGQQVRFDRLDILMDPEAVGTGVVHAKLIRVVRPSFISPVDTISTPFDPFVDIPGPRTRIDRLVIEDGTFGTLAHPSQHDGRWLWHAQGVDVDVRDITLGGGGPIAAHVVSANAAAELRGRPILLRSGSTDVRRTSSLLEVDVALRLADSDIAVTGTLRRTGEFQADVTTSPLAFADARTFMPELPAEGAAEIDATIQGGTAPFGISLRRMIARARSSVVAASGDIRTGDDGAVRDLVLDVRTLTSADLDSLFGFALPGGGVWSGGIRADGPLTSGVAISGTLERAADSPPPNGSSPADAAVPRFAFDGTAVLAEDGEVDARIVVDPVPLTMLPFPAAFESVRGDVLVEIGIAGTLDAPILTGTVDVRDGGFRVPSVRLDVRDLAGAIVVRDGVADFNALAARANGGTLDVGGTVRLSGGGTAEVTLAARDVALIARDSVRVLANADISARGPVVEPLLTAEAGLTLAGSAGPLSLAELRGTLDMARDGALDFVLRADSLPLDALPSPSAVRDLRGGLTGSVRIGGTMDAPATAGRFELHDAGVTVVRTGTALRDLDGAAVVRDGVVTLEGVRGTVGGGVLAIEGVAHIGAERRTVEARMTIDRGLVVDTDSMQIVASADVTASGELSRPRLGGRLVLHEGWVHEDNFARSQPIDTASPPYEELIERVPWILESRLRTRAARPLEADQPPEPDRQVVVPAPPRDVAQAVEENDAPPLTGRLRIDIERGLRLVDEDSEIRGEGTVYLVADSAGLRTEGLYRLIGGYYAQYGSVFEIRGGAFLFAGDGISPIVSMRSEHRFEAPLGSWLTPAPRIMDRFPPLQFFSLGDRESAREEVRRMSLLPESRTELGALLLYNEEPQPVTGMRTHSFWAPDDGGSLFGESSATRGTVLVYNYIANESYDYLPLERAYMRAGTIEVGPERPGRITIGPYLQGGLHLGGLHAIITQPVEGGTAPGIRLRYSLGAPELLAFSEPRFLSTAPLTGGAVFTHGRTTGVGVRWLWEW